MPCLVTLRLQARAVNFCACIQTWPHDDAFWRTGKGGMPVFEILLVRSFLMSAVAGGAIVNSNISPWGTR